MEDSGEDSERREALADLRRLTNIILNNLEEGSRGKLMDPKEIRLLGGTAIRSIRLWLAAIERDQGEEADRRPGESGEKVGSGGRGG